MLGLDGEPPRSDPSELYGFLQRVPDCLPLQTIIGWCLKPVVAFAWPVRTAHSQLHALTLPTQMTHGECLLAHRRLCCCSLRPVR